jgi:hypothetical protein
VATGEGVNDLAINLLASVIAGTAVWLAQRLLRYRRTSRRRAFLGLVPGAPVLIVVGRHASSPAAMSVNKADVAAVLDLAVLVKEAGAEPTIALHTEAADGVGERVEFCVGGPESNQRTAAHLRWLLPGFTQAPYAEDPEGLSLRVGTRVFRREPGSCEYVLLARVFAAGRPRPLFLVCGQTAISNHAATRYLVNQQHRLRSSYGTSASFCLILRIVNSASYGSGVVEVVADVTAATMAGSGSPL